MMWIAEAQVVSTVSPGRVSVQLRSGVIPDQPIRVGYGGFADALRVHSGPLPTRGTWGIVIFLNGDIRNGVWICSIYTSFLNALPGNGDNPQSAFWDYDAQWSGYWRLLDDVGQEFVAYPDGSYSTTTSGAPAGLPTIYRYTVDNKQVSQRIPYPATDRTAAPPSPFSKKFHHASGNADVTIDQDGNVAATLAGGATATLTVNGTVATIGADGSTSITGKSGSTISFIVNGATIKIDAAGNVDVITTKMNVGTAPAADAAALVSLLVTAFNSHIHPSPDGATGPPTVPWTPATIESSILALSG